jgi:hypothetical protein
MARLSDKLTDLDFAILGLLPLEGSQFGNHTYAKQVGNITEELGDATAAQVQGRLRSLKLHGLTVTRVVQPANKGLGWQRTILAEDILNERRGIETPKAEVIPMPGQTTIEEALDIVANEAKQDPKMSPEVERALRIVREAGIDLTNQHEEDDDGRAAS